MPAIDFHDPIGAAREIAARISAAASNAKDQASSEFRSLHSPGDVASLFNRGLIANTLGAPVDATATALRAAGVPVGDQPWGGSENIGSLMERAGLTSPVRRPMLESAAGLLPAAVGAAPGMARGAMRAGAAALEDLPAAGSARAQQGAVKLPGGNWAKAGSGVDTVQHVLNPIKKWEPDTPGASPEMHVNNWIDKKLAPYVKNQMGTDSDPVLKLADQGTLHFDPTERLDGGIGASVSARKSRSEAGFPMTNSGSTPLGQAWSDATDQAIRTRQASELQAMPQHMRNNPWLASVDPSAPVHQANYSPFEDLGFGHLTDELHNAVNPDNPTGLPQQLRWKPEDLQKVSVPQAVQRVSDINDWRAKNAGQANLALQNEFPVHKAYDDGMKWVNLNHPTDPNKTAAMLQQEGSAMGHCVGGYCDDVTRGNSNIYSLRDPQGQPHVTVETNPQRTSPYDAWYGKNIGGPEQDAFVDWASKNGVEGGLEGAYNKWVQSTGRTPEPVPEDIAQIKGKGNKAPADKYLPYVQDFVKSGSWSDVNDLENTGLVDRSSPTIGNIKQALGDKYPLLDPTTQFNLAGRANPSAPRFMTPDEFRAHLSSVDPTLAPPQATPGFKRGGRVAFEDPITAMQMIRMGNP